MQDSSCLGYASSTNIEGQGVALVCSAPSRPSPLTSRLSLYVVRARGPAQGGGRRRQLEGAKARQNDAREEGGWGMEQGAVLCSVEVLLACGRSRRAAASRRAAPRSSWRARAAPPPAPPPAAPPRAQATQTWFVRALRPSDCGGARAWRAGRGAQASWAAARGRATAPPSLGASPSGACARPRSCGERGAVGADEEARDRKAGNGGGGGGRRRGGRGARRLRARTRRPCCRRSCRRQRRGRGRRRAHAPAPAARGAEGSHAAAGGRRHGQRPCCVLVRALARRRAGARARTAARRGCLAHMRTSSRLRRRSCRPSICCSARYLRGPPPRSGCLYKCWHWAHHAHWQLSAAAALWDR